MKRVSLDKSNLGFYRLSRFILFSNDNINKNVLLT